MWAIHTLIDRCEIVLIFGRFVLSLCGPENIVCIYIPMYSINNELYAYFHLQICKEV